MTGVADVLNGAADLIERDGWCQGTFRDGGARCASRAIGDAAENTKNPHGPDWSDAAHICLRKLTGHWFVSGWNDKPGRTKAEVVAALRAAAERAL